MFVVHTTACQITSRKAVILVVELVAFQIHPSACLGQCVSSKLLSSSAHSIRRTNSYSGGETFTLTADAEEWHYSVSILS